MKPFSPSHYEMLLPLKKKWETYKLNKVANLNSNDQQLITKVLREVTGREPSWCCTPTIAENFRQAMIRFEEYEKGIEN